MMWKMLLRRISRSMTRSLRSILALTWMKVRHAFSITSDRLCIVSSVDAEESEGGEDDEAANGEGEKNEAEAEKPKDGEKEDVDGGEKEDEDKSEQEAEDEEDPSNLQLAWEMLELAKVSLCLTLNFLCTDLLQVVFAKTAETQKDAELERRICETYMVLGEVSLENENYPQAVEDLTICLNKRIEGLPADSRYCWGFKYL